MVSYALGDDMGTRHSHTLESLVRLPSEPVANSSSRRARYRKTPSPSFCFKQVKKAAPGFFLVFIVRGLPYDELRL